MSLFGRQPGQPRYSGQLHNMSVTEAVFGTTLPIVFGTTRVHGKLLDYSNFTVTQVSEGGGKGIFGGKGQIANYSANTTIAFAQGPCVGLLNVYDQQGMLANNTVYTTYTVPNGGGSYTAPANSSAPPQYDLGVTTQQGYSVTATDFGATGPRTLSGVQTVALQSAAEPTSPLEYKFDPVGKTWTFPSSAAGLTVAISYSCTFSLYYFEETQAAQIPLNAPYTISTNNQQYFDSDKGVTFVDSGQALAVVGTGSAPSQEGTYNELVGFYTFAPGDAGRYVYIKYQYTSSDPDVTNSSTLNLTFYNGAQSQPSPGGSALGYSGICYGLATPMAMGDSPVLPAYNYEIAGQCIIGGQKDADLTAAITLLLTNPLCGVNFPSAALGPMTALQAYWGANSYFGSDCLTSQQAVSETIKSWVDAGNVGAVWSGSTLNFVPYGDSTAVGNGYTYTPPGSVVTLTWDDFLPLTDKKTGEKTSDDPWETERVSARDAYNYMQVQYTDRLNNYNVALLDEQNDAFIQKYGLRMEGPQAWTWITSEVVAAWALNLRLKRALYKRNTYSFALGWNFSYLEPMDLITFPTGEVVRVTEIEDDADGKRTMKGEQWTYGSGTATIYPKQQTNSYQPVTSQAIPGNTSAYIFEATPQYVLGKPNTVQIAVAGNQASWGGCDIYVSSDGQTYTKLDRIRSNNKAGLLTAALAAKPDPDTTETLSVDMTPSGGELVSSTKAEADQFVTLSAIVDRSGSLELISYENVSLTAANRYNLSYLRRGVYGTSVLAHAIGAEFVYLGTSGVYSYQYPAQYVGKTLYFKFPSFNLLQGQLQGLDTCKVFSFMIPGTTLQPPSSGTLAISPANPITAATQAANSSTVTVSTFTASLNNLSVTCLPGTSWTSAAVPPGDTFFVYYIDYAFAGGNITPILTLNAADFQGKTGYYLIGTITTPAYTPPPATT